MKIKKIIIEDENGNEREINVSQYEHIALMQETGVRKYGQISEFNGNKRMMIKLWTGSVTWEGFRTDN